MSRQAYYASRALYRSRCGWIFGVCRGIADYADISPIWVRLAFVILAVTTAFFPMVLVYLVLAIVVKPEPLLRPETEDDWAFYDVYAASRSRALSQLKRRLEELDRRARRIEDVVTTPGFDWEQRLNA